MSNQQELEIKVKKIMYHKTLHKLLHEFLSEEVYGNGAERKKEANSQGTAPVNTEKKTETKEDEYEEGELEEGEMNL
jgi:hypothetical protein